MTERISEPVIVCPKGIPFEDRINCTDSIRAEKIRSNSLRGSRDQKSNSNQVWICQFQGYEGRRCLHDENMVKHYNNKKD